MTDNSRNVNERKDVVWQRNSEVERFLNSRGGIPFASEQIDILLRLVDASQQPVRRILDLGCGSGAMSVGLLVKYPESTAVLVDFSEPMLDAAREALADKQERISFHNADLCDPGWRACATDAAPFDAVVSGFAIHHLPDERKQALFREIYALLAPGGWFFNLEHVASASPWLEERFWDYLADAKYEHHVKMGTPRPREEIVAESGGNTDARAANILQLTEEQCRWLRETGFEHVDCYFKVFELALFGGRKPGV